MESLNIVDLPVELMCQILAYLQAPVDLYHCILTCTFFQRIIMDSVELQLALEMGIHRMICTVPTSTGDPPTIATRLELLRQRQRAWRHLQWQEEFSIEYPGFGQDSLMYEYVASVYSHGNFESVSFVQLLPSSIRGKAVSWSHSMDILEFATDPMQDLLILLTASPAGSEYAITLEARTMTTNEPHPKAIMPVHGSLKGHVNLSLAWDSTLVQVAGDFVALLVRGMVGGIGSYIEIWNWTKTNLTHRCDLIESTSIDDLCFLSITTILVTSSSDGIITIYEFEDPAISNSGLICKGDFQLPVLTCRYSYGFMYTSCHPVGSDAFHSRTPIPSLQASLFCPSPDDRICSIYIPLQQATGPTVSSHTLIIHIRVFTGLDPVVSIFLDAHPGAPVPWTVWGPQNTRWCPEDFRTMVFASYGLKVIASVPEPFNSTDNVEILGTKLRLRDFNPYTFPTPVNDAELEDWQKGWVVTTPLCILAGDIFAQEVESRLPYREVISERRFHVTEAMMDGNQIVLLKRNSVDSDTLTVLTF